LPLVGLRSAAGPIRNDIERAGEGAAAADPTVAMDLLMRQPRPPEGHLSSTARRAAAFRDGDSLVVAGAVVDLGLVALAPQATVPLR
jgi:hypothetical protein